MGRGIQQIQSSYFVQTKELDRPHYLNCDKVRLSASSIIKPALSTMTRAKQVKVAAVQAAPVAFNLEESLKKVEKLTAEAAKQGAELVAFP